MFYLNSSHIPTTAAVHLLTDAQGIGMDPGNVRTFGCIAKRRKW